METGKLLIGCALAVVFPHLPRAEMQTAGFDSATVLAAGLAPNDSAQGTTPNATKLVDRAGSGVLTEKEAAEPGSDFKECAKGCPLMVVIPAGSFSMGSPDDAFAGTGDADADQHERESPQHEVMIAQTFAVSKFEVTFSEWDACAVAGPCPAAPDSWGRGEMPVINVSWEDAKVYVEWLSLLTGEDYRLLSEAEWEYAARAGTDSRYSWGDDLRTDSANCDGCGSRWDLKQTAPVGSFKPNAFGLHDMHGNVWEWTEDSWHANYNGAPSDGSAWLSGGDPSIRIVRGGAWRNEGYLVRAAVRERRHVKVRFDTLGFRVARTLAR